MISLLFVQLALAPTGAVRPDSPSALLQVQPTHADTVHAPRLVCFRGKPWCRAFTVTEVSIAAGLDRTGRGAKLDGETTLGAMVRANPSLALGVVRSWHSIESSGPRPGWGLRGRYWFRSSAAADLTVERARVPVEDGSRNTTVVSLAITPNDVIGVFVQRDRLQKGGQVQNAAGARFGSWAFVGLEALSLLLYVAAGGGGG